MLFLALSNCKSLGKLLQFSDYPFIIWKLGLAVLQSMLGRFNQTLNILSVSQPFNTFSSLLCLCHICNVLRDKGVLYKEIIVTKILMATLNQCDELSKSFLKFYMEVYMFLTSRG